MLLRRIDSRVDSPIWLFIEQHDSRVDSPIWLFIEQHDSRVDSRVNSSANRLTFVIFVDFLVAFLIFQNEQDRRYSGCAGNASRAHNK